MAKKKTVKRKAKSASPTRTYMAPIRFDFGTAEKRKIQKMKADIPKFERSEFKQDIKRIRELRKPPKLPAVRQKKTFAAEEKRIRELSKPNVKKVVSFGSYRDKILSSDPAMRKEIYKVREGQKKSRVVGLAREFLGGKEKRLAQVALLKESLKAKEQKELQKVGASYAERSKVKAKHAAKLRGAIDILKGKREGEEIAHEEKVDKIKSDHDAAVAKAKKALLKKQIRSPLTFAEQSGSRIATLAKQYGRKRVVARRVLRPSNTRAVVKEYQAPSVLGDPNRYFKDKYEEDKRNLFFS